MLDARSSLFAALRVALTGGEQRSALARSAIEDRVHTTRLSARPGTNMDLVDQYCNKHIAVHGTVNRIAGFHNVVAATEEYCSQQQLGKDLVVGSGAILDKVMWPPEWSANKRPANVSDKIVLSEAYAGISETGTMVFIPKSGSPASQIFLGTHHIVVLDSSLIVACQEDLWRIIRTDHEVFPRAVNLVTGPSKTGDVEQTIEYGAHGPERVHLILVDV